MDVLVNNAGLMALAPIAKTLVDEWDRMVDINIKGVLYGIAAALPCLHGRRAATSSTLLRSPDTRCPWGAPCTARRNTPCGLSPKEFGKKWTGSGRPSSRPVPSSRSCRSAFRIPRRPPAPRSSTG